MSLALRDMPGLRNIAARSREFSEFAGLNILGCVTVTSETGAFVRTLAALGANVRWCSDNQFASDDDVVCYLAGEGIPVFARSNMSATEYFHAMDRARDFPNGIDEQIHVIDDGADITGHIARSDPTYFGKVSEITEQTTCGVAELRTLYARGLLPVPAININDCFIKKNFDNYHGVQESLVRGLMTATGMQLAGKLVSIFGYGSVGKGAAIVLRAVGCRVAIVERDLLKAVQAHFDGFEVFDPVDAVRLPHICITATGCDNTVSAELIDQAGDGLILCNIGHGSAEFDVAYLRELSSPQVVNSFLDAHPIGPERTIYSLCQGALTNLIAGRGNPPAIMSLTFTLHVLAQREFLRNGEDYAELRVHRLPRHVEVECATLNHPELLGRLYSLSPRQADYLRAHDAEC